MDFRSVPLFKNIPEEKCHSMLGCLYSVERMYKPGQTVCDFFDRGVNFGIVAEGEVQLERIDPSGERTVMEKIHENGVFSKLLVFFNGKDRVTVTCKKSCRVIFIDYIHLTRFCERACDYHSELIRNMISLVSERAGKLAERIDVISRRNTKDKLMCYFRMLARSGDTAVLPFNLTHLADYICADRSAMMRELKHLKDDGYISINKRYVKILREWNPEPKPAENGEDEEFDTVD